MRPTLFDGIHGNPEEALDISGVLEQADTIPTESFELAVPSLTLEFESWFLSWFGASALFVFEAVQTL